VPPDRLPLRVNLDETSIVLQQPSLKGALTPTARAQRRTPQGLRRDVPHQHRRAYLSYVALICDDHAVQPLLPQTLVCNEKLLSAAMFDELQTMLTPTIRMWRRNSAWLDAKGLIKILEDLAAALSALNPKRHVILSLDAYRVHLDKKIWRACARLGFFMFVIPAKMTWCLQPLDAQVFGCFKQILKRNSESIDIAETASKEVYIRLVTAVIQTIQEVFQNRSWYKAFSDLGLLGVPCYISPRVRAQLQYEGPNPSNSGLPSLHQLQCLWPKRSVIPLNECFASVEKLFAPPLRGVNLLARFRKQLTRRGPVTRAAARLSLSSTAASSSEPARPVGAVICRSHPTLTSSCIPPPDQMLRLPSSARLPPAPELQTLIPPPPLPPPKFHTRSTSGQL